MPTDPTDEEVLRLERAGWEALSTGAGAATTFYRAVLDDAVTMVLPGGLLLRGVSEVVASMAGPPWSAHHLGDERIVAVSDDVRMLTYRASARRDDREHQALCTSVYVRRDDGWRLVLHQQTTL